MGIKQPDKEKVFTFLKQNNAVQYDFKVEHQDLKEDKFNSNIERILFFKSDNFKAKFDPDCIALTMSFMCLYLEMRGMGVEGYSGRTIYLENGTMLETDTAFSFISLYKEVLEQKMQDFLKKYKATTNKKLKQHFSIKDIYDNQNVFTLEGCDEKILILFEEFAALTHSIGNFILGPKGFNFEFKKSKAKISSCNDWNKFDRPDIFLKKIGQGEIYTAWKDWFEQHLIAMDLDVFYDNIKQVTGVKRINLKESTLIDLQMIEYEVRQRKINRIISARGDKMIKCMQLYYKKDLY